METKLIVRYFVNLLWYHIDLFCPKDSDHDLEKIIEFARLAVESLQASEERPDDYMTIAFRKIIISTLDDFGNFSPEADDTVPWNESEKKFLLECVARAIEIIKAEIDTDPENDPENLSADFLKQNGLTMNDENPPPCVPPLP
jgi:hypothetical protein